MSVKSILYIHGLDEKNRGDYVAWLLQCLNKFGRKTSKNTSVYPNKARFTIDNATVELSEFYYFQHVRSREPESLPIWERPLFALSVIRYWFFSKIWTAISNKWIAVGLIFSGVVLVFSLVISLLFLIVVVGPALMNHEYFISFKTWLAQIGWISSVKNDFGFSISGIQRFSTSALVVFWLGWGLQKTIVRVSSFSMCLMHEQNFRDQILKELDEQVQSVVQSQSELRLVAHSMGVLLLIEYLYHYRDSPHLQKLQIDVVMIGGAVSLFSLREPSLKTKLDTVLKLNHIRSVKDIFSRDDFYCSYKEINNSVSDASDKAETLKLEFGARFYQKVTRKVHVDAYFENQQVLESVFAYGNRGAELNSNG